jgi:hypothetical protein
MFTSNSNTAKLFALTCMWMGLLVGAVHAGEAIAKEDVEVYDSPNGGSVVRTLREGTQVKLGDCESRCPILRGPGAGGWVRSVAMNMNPPSAGMRRKTSASYPRDVKVVADVDLYDKPGGNGKVIGIVRQGTSTLSRSCRKDNWCPVGGGWVWGDFLVR